MEILTVLTGTGASCGNKVGGTVYINPDTTARNILFTKTNLAQY